MLSTLMSQGERSEGEEPAAAGAPAAAALQRDLAFQRDGALLRGTVAGAGPTVLLLHAGGERRQVWEPVLGPLAAAGLRAVAYDQRGHGASSGSATSLPVFGEDVRAMVARETGPIVVVGASLGGLAALAALAEGETARRVAGVVLVDVVPDPAPEAARAWLGRRGLLRHGRAALVDDILGRGPQLLSTATRWDGPIVLVRGDRSPIGDDDVDRLRAANPRVRVTTVRGAGHLVARDAPTRLARIVVHHASRWLATDPAVQRAFALQRSLGAEGQDHPGGSLLAHLHRVHALAVEWGAAPRTRLAAISHATYGTDGFPHALLERSARRRLCDAIGEDAEGLVHLYARCDRARTYPPQAADRLTVHDRWTGGAATISGRDLRDLAVLTIANELDVARHAPLPPSSIREIRALVDALAPHAPAEAGRALADGALG